MSILEVTNLRKVYSTRFGGNTVEALKNVSFTVEKGEYVAIMGESGSGKTTLLNLLAALDKPTGGSILLEGRELSRIRDSEAAAFRRDHLGFVFQEFNLLDTFTLEDNIYLPLIMAGIHLAYAYPFISKIMLIFAFDNLFLNIMVNLICFALFALFYAIVYKITSGAYYAIVSGCEE